MKCFSWLNCIFPNWFYNYKVIWGRCRYSEKQMKSSTKRKQNSWEEEPQCPTICYTLLSTLWNAAEFTEQAALSLAQCVPRSCESKTCRHKGWKWGNSNKKLEIKSFLEISQPQAMTVDSESRCITSFPILLAVNLFWNHQFRKKEILTL